MKFISYGILLLSAALLSESFSIAKRSVKDDLVNEINQLKELAEQTVQKLKTDGNQQLAEVIEVAEKQLDGLVGQIQSVDESSELGKLELTALEALVKLAVDALKKEIDNANNGSYYDDTDKDDLKNSIEKLKEEAKKEIEKLKAEGKVALAVGIQDIEKKLEDFETQIEKLNPQTAVGKALLSALEGLVKKAEEELEAEIKKLSGSYYDGDLKDTLLLEAEKLKKAAEEEIEKLKKEGKTELAKGIEAVEKVVLDLESQLQALNPTTEVGKALLSAVEGLLKKAEEKLEEEIKKLSGSYYDDVSVKDDLKKELEGIKEAAKKEIEELKKDGKGALAVGLETVEKKVEDLENQLEKLNPNTEVGKALLSALEGLVRKAEEKLKEEIAKLSGSFYDTGDDVKKALADEVEKLKKEAEEEIEKLKKEGKGKLAEGLEAVEKRVVDIETQLEKLNPTTDLGKALLSTLENLLKKAAEDLEAEIKKLSGSYYDGDLKDTLLLEAEKLKKAAEEEIEKLKKEGKTELAKGIEAVEKVVLDLESQLQALNPTTEVGKALLSALEGLLKKAEDKLEEEIKKLSGSYYDDTTKDDVKDSIEKLKEEAKKEIEKLKSEGKAALAIGLETVEKKLEDLEAQVEKLNPDTEVGKALLSAVEGLVKKAEEKLKEEIAKLSGSFYDTGDDVKKALADEVEKLKKEAEEEIEKLKKEGKGKLAEGLEAVEKRVVDIETQLEKLNPTTDLGKALLSTLENLLKKAAEDLEAEIKKLSGSF